MAVGTNIKKRRFEMKLTQDELAKILGYKSKSTIAKIESGENGISTKKLNRFAKALDTSVENLLSGESTQRSINHYISQSGKKTIAIILAGGKSTRNQHSIPNQFITVAGKPIIIHTMEAYQKHPAINEIIVVCLKGWDDILKTYAIEYGISKMTSVIPAGESGILSLKNAIDHLNNRNESIESTIIIQESTRPLVTSELISKMLLEYKVHGTAVTSGSMNDHIQFINKQGIIEYIDRNRVFEVQSPESYNLSLINKAYKLLEANPKLYDSSCFCMALFELKFDIHFFECNIPNNKIIRNEDLVLLTNTIYKHTQT